MKTNLLLASLLAYLEGSKQSIPNNQELASFREECRNADLSTLGNLLFTSPTRFHEKIAEHEINRRLMDLEM